MLHHVLDRVGHGLRDLAGDGVARIADSGLQRNEQHADDDHDPDVLDGALAANGRERVPDTVVNPSPGHEAGGRAGSSERVHGCPSGVVVAKRGSASMSWPITTPVRTTAIRAYSRDGPPATALRDAIQLTSSSPSREPGGSAASLGESNADPSSAVLPMLTASFPARATCSTVRARRPAGRAISDARQERGRIEREVPPVEPGMQGTHHRAVRLGHRDDVCVRTTEGRLDLARVARGRRQERPRLDGHLDDHSTHVRVRGGSESGRPGEAGDDLPQVVDHEVAVDRATLRITVRFDQRETDIAQRAPVVRRNARSTARANAARSVGLALGGPRPPGRWHRAVPA